MDYLTALQMIIAEYQKLEKIPVNKEQLDEIYITFREEGKYVK